MAAKSTSSSQTSGTGNTGTSEPSPEEVQDQIKQLRADISSLTDSVQRMGAGKVSHLQRRASKAGDDAMHTYKDTVDELSRQVSSMEKDLESRVRANPIQSMGIAAGVGFLAAMLMRR